MRKYFEEGGKKRTLTASWKETHTKGKKGTIEHALLKMQLWIFLGRSLPLPRVIAFFRMLLSVSKLTCWRSLLSLY